MPFFKKTDIIIILLIFTLSILIWFGFEFFFFNTKKPTKVEIYYYSELIKTVDLTKGAEESFSFSQNENVVFQLYSDGGICFKQSDCPDQVCVNTGKLYKAGQYASCLNNCFVLKFVSEDNKNNNQTDIIVGN